MNQRCCSKFLFLLGMLALMLLGLVLSVEARGVNDSGLSFEDRVVDASSSMAGKGRLRRQLQTPTKSSAATSSTTGDDTTSDSKTDDDITTVNKSIASRTSSVTSTKKDLGSSMNVRFVKPETAAPTVPPPSSPPTLKPVAKKIPSASNSTLTKAGPAMSANNTVSNPSPRMTYPPATENLESIASKTATDGIPKVPLSDSMEFEMAETSPPNSTHTNYTQKVNESSWAIANATGEFGRVILQNKQDKNSNLVQFIYSFLGYGIHMRRPPTLTIDFCSFCWP